MTLNLQWQDTSVRAQDDFYRHWLGQWLDTFTIPEDKAEFASFTDLHDTAQEQLKAIIDELSAAAPDPDSNAGRIAVLFNAFMDTDEIDRVGLEPIADLFAEVDALTSTAQVAGVLRPARARGGRLAVGWRSAPGQPGLDQVRPRHVAERVGHARPRLLPRGRFRRPPRGVPATRCGDARPMRGRAAAEDADRIVALETRMAQAHWTKVANRDPVKTYNQYQLDELPELTAGYDWQGYLGAAGVTGRIETLNIAQPDYAKAYAAMLDEVGLDDWKPYLRWRDPSSLHRAAVGGDGAGQFEFYGKVLEGRPRSARAGSGAWTLVEGVVGEALGQDVRRSGTSRRSTRRRMVELVDNLLAAFEQSIDGLEWMTDTTKREAHAKLAKFTAKIGYPDMWRDYSASWCIERGDRCRNAKRARHLRVRRELDKLGDPVDRNEWHMTPQTVNAYYNPRHERDRVPGGDPAAAVLRPRRRRRGQLRRHRRGDRPRDLARFRRPGLAVRRRRQPAQLVVRLRP